MLIHKRFLKRSGVKNGGVLARRKARFGHSFEGLKWVDFNGKKPAGKQIGAC